MAAPEGVRLNKKYDESDTKKQKEQKKPVPQVLVNIKECTHKKAVALWRGRPHHEAPDARLQAIVEELNLQYKLKRQKKDGESYVSANNPDGEIIYKDVSKNPDGKKTADSDCYRVNVRFNPKNYQMTGGSQNHCVETGCEYVATTGHFAALLAVIYRDMVEKAVAGQNENTPGNGTQEVVDGAAAADAEIMEVDEEQPANDAEMEVDEMEVSTVAAAAAAAAAAAPAAAAAAAATALPVAADIGRRLQVHWEGEGEWFPGVLAAIEAGHDDGADTGDYHVIYDDGDEQWEPLGSRTPFRWSGDRLPSAPSHGSSSGEALSPPGRAPPRPKRALSERSHLIALPEAKASSCSNSNVEIDLQ